MAVPTVQVDDERFRVTEWRFAPGAHTGWHRHEMDYVVVPMTTGPLRIRTKDGETTGDLVTGRAYSRIRGAEHDVTNLNAFEVVFVEVEVKAQVKTS
jgi:quercetin dioxygenase-like cupin family protein